MRKILCGCWNFIRGPRVFYRQRIKFPIIKFVYDTVQLYKARTKKGINNVRDILFRGTVVASVTSLLVWLSIFMYLAFYYAYVPTISHERPVYLQFKSCENEKGICSFPSAHVQLTKRQQLLMFGQPYKVHLELEMPESPNNKDLGMFMVCADFRGKDGFLVASSCRSTMLHYKSWITEVLYTLMFSPFFVLGGSEEKQQIHVELFADYEEREVNQPVTDVYIEIQTRHIQLYSAKFLINAHFSGLRYLMFHWPVLSAAIGITSNLFFIAVVCMISWYQLIHSEEYRNYIESKERESKLDYFKSLEGDSSSSSSFEDDTSMLRETEGGENKLRKRLEGREEREVLQDINPDTR